MTKPEITGKRDLTFSRWVRKYLPDSKTGFLVSDLDFILCNYKTKKFMLLEIKTRLKKRAPWQRILFENLDKWVKKGIDKDWIYLGYHVITFEKIFFNDGKCYFDGKFKTEKEIISILSL